MSNIVNITPSIEYPRCLYCGSDRMAMDFHIVTTDGDRMHYSQCQDCKATTPWKFNLDDAIELAKNSRLSGKNIIAWLENNDDARMELATEFAEHVLEGYEDLEYDDCFRNILFNIKGHEAFQ